MLNRENKIELNNAGATSAADMIKEILDSFHTTQVDFAERIGVSQKGVRTKSWTSGMMSLCIQKQTRKELSSSTTNIIIHGVQ